ncbi:hypothetical protein [Chlorogloeopsis sp. ULAP02]|uniref:hypothetical protein n=1 Tax=Chlorogloeopsis sp. ULAP02 TaxID=3107926 RepID=UPI003134F2BF
MSLLWCDRILKSQQIISPHELRLPRDMKIPLHLFPQPRSPISHTPQTTSTICSICPMVW